MAFDAADFRDQLESTPMYIGNPSLLQSAGWVRNMSGHDLVHKSSGEILIGILVAKISDFRLQCTPSGNFRTDTKFEKEFKKAKFQFSAGIPDEQILESTFNNAVANLIKLQKTHSTTGVNRNLVEDNASSVFVRFGANIFEKRVRVFLIMILQTSWHKLT